MPPRGEKIIRWTWGFQPHHIRIIDSGGGGEYLRYLLKIVRNENIIISEKDRQIPKSKAPIKNKSYRVRESDISFIRKNGGSKYIRLLIDNMVCLDIFGITLDEL